MDPRPVHFSSFLATVELDLHYTGNSNSISKYLEIMEENRALQGFNISDQALVRGIVLMLMAGSSGQVTGKSATLSFRKTDRIRLNWPDFMISNGELDFLLAGRETIGPHTMRYRVSFTGKLSAKPGICYHDFLGYQDQKELKDLMANYKVKYDKKTGRLYVTL